MAFRGLGVRRRRCIRAIPWVALAVAMLAACGRVGFDPTQRSDGGADAAVDARVPPARRHLVVGWQHACVLEPSGALYCWGDNGTVRRRYVDCSATS